jgi:hypothetical protein
MNLSETRAYNRGYGAGARNAEKKVLRAHHALLEMQERAERAEASLGLGRCDACCHWKREQHAANECRWGWCTLSEQNVGVDWPWRGTPNQKIATKENFGCIRFKTLADGNDEAA